MGLKSVGWQQDVCLRPCLSKWQLVAFSHCSHTSCDIVCRSESRQGDNDISTLCNIPVHIVYRSHVPETAHKQTQKCRNFNVTQVTFSWVTGLGVSRRICWKTARRRSSTGSDWFTAPSCQWESHGAAKSPNPVLFFKRKKTCVLSLWKSSVVMAYSVCLTRSTVSLGVLPNVAPLLSCVASVEKKASVCELEYCKLVFCFCCLQRSRAVR